MTLYLHTFVDRIHQRLRIQHLKASPSCKEQFKKNLRGGGNFFTGAYLFQFTKNKAKNILMGFYFMCPNPQENSLKQPRDHRQVYSLKSRTLIGSAITENLYFRQRKRQTDIVQLCIIDKRKFSVVHIPPIYVYACKVYLFN